VLTPVSGANNQTEQQREAHVGTLRTWASCARLAASAFIGRLR